jgi:hypothetical protein
MPFIILLGDFENLLSGANMVVLPKKILRILGL